MKEKMASKIPRDWSWLFDYLRIFDFRFNYSDVAILEKNEQ